MVPRQIISSSMQTSGNTTMQDSKNQNQVLYELNVLPGKADELKEIGAKMVNMNAAEEPGTLVYNV